MSPIRIDIYPSAGSKGFLFRSVVVGVRYGELAAQNQMRCHTGMRVRRVVCISDKAVSLSYGSGWLGKLRATHGPSLQVKTWLNLRCGLACIFLYHVVEMNRIPTPKNELLPLRLSLT